MGTAVSGRLCLRTYSNRVLPCNREEDFAAEMAQ